MSCEKNVHVHDASVSSVNRMTLGLYEVTGNPTTRRGTVQAGHLNMSVPLLHLKYFARWSAQLLCSSCVTNNLNYDRLPLPRASHEPLGSVSNLRQHVASSLVGSMLLVDGLAT